MLAIMTVPTGKLRILPTEHGVWGLLAGAALVGLLLSHNLAGLGLLVAVLAAVIARQGVVGWRQAPRSAAGVVGMAGLVGMGGILVTWLFAPTTAWLPWAVAMAIVGGVQLLWMWLRPGRPWLVSAVGGLAFAMLAAAVAAAGEALVSSSVLAAVVLAGHFLVMVPLVRAQTRREPRWSELAIDLHLVILLAAMAAWAMHLVHLAIPALFTLGLARTLLMVDKTIHMSATRAQRIGMQEMAWLLVVATAIVVAVRQGA